MVKHRKRPSVDTENAGNANEELKGGDKWGRLVTRRRKWRKQCAEDTEEAVPGLMEHLLLARAKNWSGWERNGYDRKMCVN